MIVRFACGFALASDFVDAASLAWVDRFGVGTLVLLPNADRAIIEDAKVRDYLIAPSHPVGRFKSVFFRALGFSPDQWEVLREALLDIGRGGDAAPGQPSPFGQKVRDSC